MTPSEGVFLLPVFKFMKKKEKIRIGLVILIFLMLFGAFFLFSKNTTKENLSLITNPTDSSPKTLKTILEINSQQYETEIAGEMSVYDFMSKLQDEGKINFTEKNYVGMGKFIDTINGIKGNGEKNWIYYVNSKKASIGISNYKIKIGDVVSWKYEKNY